MVVDVDEFPFLDSLLLRFESTYLELVVELASFIVHKELNDLVVLERYRV